MAAALRSRFDELAALYGWFSENSSILEEALQQQQQQRAPERRVLQQMQTIAEDSPVIVKAGRANIRRIIESDSEEEDDKEEEKEQENLPSPSSTISTHDTDLSEQLQRLEIGTDRAKPCCPADAPRKKAQKRVIESDDDDDDDDDDYRPDEDGGDGEDNDDGAVCHDDSDGGDDEGCDDEEGGDDASADPSPEAARYQPAPPKTPRTPHTTKTSSQAPDTVGRKFQKTRTDLANHYYKVFNKVIFEDRLPASMPLTWSKKLNSTAGRTICSRHAGTYRAEIELSVKVVDRPERLQSTLCHEMCHAAAWLMNHNIKPPHGAIFKHYARYKFRWKCVSCGHIYGRHSNSIKPATQRCGRCTGVLQPMPRLKVDGTPARARAPSAFAVFVKGNFKTLQQQNPGLPHAALMKLLGARFKRMTASEIEGDCSQPAPPDW